MISPSHSDYTRAWVGYEVGLAAERGLPVVVVEPRSQTVNLPVPGATHYLRRMDVAQENMSTEWQVVAKTACATSGPILEGERIRGLSPPPRRGDPKPGERVGYLKVDTLDAIDFPPIYRAVEDQGVFHRAVCPSDRCGATFMLADSIWGWDESYPCPSCRHEIKNLNAPKF